MRTLIVAGNFDEAGGRPSKLIDKMFESVKEEATIVNGGLYSDLVTLIETVTNYDAVFWFASVDNSLPKVRNIKEVNQKCMLVTSKRNDNEKYCFEELINHALMMKANLTFEFTKVNDIFNIRVFDPLGTVWCDTTPDFEKAVKQAYKRLEKLRSFTRKSTVVSDELIEFHVEDRFLDIIKEKAVVFHDLIQPPEVVDRFLGNVSFRCTHGFPSCRMDEYMIVSRRNVDKTGISDKDFVPVKLGDDGKMTAYSQNRPSVDTPIQVQLYKIFPDIKFMMHGHVYIKDAPFTTEAISCGALEEIESIKSAIIPNGIDTSKSFSINLLGHGSIVFATELDYFDQIEYVKRPMPEILG